MKNTRIAIFSIIATTTSLPALAGPNWLVIDQERQDQVRFSQENAPKDRCPCPKNIQSLNGKAMHGLAGMHASQKNHAASSRQS